MDTKDVFFQFSILVHDHYIVFNTFSAGIDFRRQIFLLDFVYSFIHLRDVYVSALKYCSLALLTYRYSLRNVSLTTNNSLLLLFLNIFQISRVIITTILVFRFVMK